MSSFQTFLDEVAEAVLIEAEDTSRMKIIFPNRRAGLFFQQRLARKIKQPLWSPEIITMETFVQSQTTTINADPLTLIFELYQAFIEVQGSQESFEKFYFWGEMLLRDFEDIDQGLVASSQIFQGIKNQKEIDELFYFLSEEDKKAIQSFWQSFFPESKEGHEQFLKTWKILHPVYLKFIESISAKGLSYTGLQYRQVAEKFKQEKVLPGGDQLIFAGFNALTPAEEVIIKYCVQEFDARIFWDEDDYYVGATAEAQEAGNYLRKYRADAILGKTFPAEPPRNFEQPKDISAVAASLEVGQAKAAGEFLAKAFQSGEMAPSNTVVVLPQEYLLFPVLNSLPENISKLNITMGYPIKETPLFSLIESLLQLPEFTRAAKDGSHAIYHKPVVSILSHPYVFSAFPEETKALLEKINKQNIIYVPFTLVAQIESESLRLLLKVPDDTQMLLKHLSEVLQMLHGSMKEEEDLSSEYFYHFHQVITRLGEIVSGQAAVMDVPILIKLFRQIARSVKIPFSGEPLEGLQIMGVLETRNLDFENVIILSMNEDSFPAAAKTNSFIPYNIRRAFGLPTFHQQDAIYAYLFYRLLQRAKKVRFYYNTQAAFGISGEISRYVNQLKFESGHQVRELQLTQSIKVKAEEAITIPKDRSVLKSLSRYLEGGGDSLSPTPLSVYLQCPLKFYFQYVARLYEPDLLSEQLDPAMFGTILHDVLELLYKDILQKKKVNIVDGNDFFAIRTGVEGAIEVAFRKFYHVEEGQKFVWEGRNLIMYNLVKDFVGKVLDMDEAYAPFEILALEGKGKEYKTPVLISQEGNDEVVMLKGTIDRVDKKEGVVRILDYKTGGDKREVKDIDYLFDPEEEKRNKAAFQLFIYTMLYQQKFGDKEPISLGIVNITEMFGKEYAPGLYWRNGGTIADARTFLPEFKAHLTSLLEDIFNPEIPFTQTENVNRCKYCPYKGICHRR